jgi:hypothetical protein
MTSEQIKALSHEELIAELSMFFCVEEFVDQTVFSKYGVRAWRFFDRRLLDNVLWIRMNLGMSMTINNWKWNGQFSQRGLRTNISPLVKGKSGLYLSAHLRGGAIDFDAKEMTAQEVRDWLVDNADGLPHKTRVEETLNGKKINWVHIDVDDEPKNPKVYLMAA